MIERTLKATYKRWDGEIISFTIRTCDLLQYVSVCQMVKKQEVLKWKESVREIEGENDDIRIWNK